MKEFDIFTDSGANIPDEFIRKYGICVIPYSCTVNGTERCCYDKDADFDKTAKEFYNLMRSGADVKTSLIGEDVIKDYITPSLKAGKDVLLFTISSGISGTNAQALAAKKELEEKFPGSEIFALDTANASMGSGLQVLKAAEMRADGKSAKECAEYAQENVYRYNSLATVGDLKYLRKGGRVSAVTAIAGTLLNIKPVLWANETSPAKLTVLTKERGKKKAFATIAEKFADTADKDCKLPVFIMHADCTDDADELATLLKARGAKDVVTGYYDLCTGTHVGPGTVAVFYYGKDRRKTAAEAKKLLFKPKKTEE